MTDIIVSCVRTHGIQQSARDYSVRLLRQVNLSILLRLAHHQRDTKECELLGPFKNSGSLGSVSPRLVNDHDFRSDATGVGIPYGIYDVLTSRGSVVDSVTLPLFAAHSIPHWWQPRGASMVGLMGQGPFFFRFRSSRAHW